jgi:hypothetical protein
MVMDFDSTNDNTVVKTLLIRKGYGMESHIVDGNNILGSL